MTREEAIIELRDIQSQDANRCHDDAVIAIDMAIEALKAESRKHGRWMGHSDDDSMPFCSVCKRARVGSSLAYVRKFIPYCEWCGAIMDEVTE